MSSSVIPAQSWACSSRWGESGWRVSDPGSIPRWLSYTWRLQSQERSPQWAPSHRSKRSFRPDQGWRGPPDSHTAGPGAVARALASSAPVPWSWVSAGNSGLPRKAGESPGMCSEVPLVCVLLWLITVSFCYILLPKPLYSSECGRNLYRLSWLPYGPHTTQQKLLNLQVSQ